MKFWYILICVLLTILFYTVLQGLAMLKASLQSKTVLTDVFLGKKRKKWPFVLVLLLLFILLAGKPQA